MRKLILIPIIHTEADLGSLAQALVEANKALLGGRRWRRHQEIVSRYWKRIGRFLGTQKIKTLVIYQDSLAKGGKVGRKIIEEGAEGESPNHKLVLKLLKGGARLERTEDPTLLKREYRLIERISKGSSLGRIFWSLWYKLCKGSLLRKRDRFVAERIAKTLKKKEKGILFIGAHHGVEAYLPKDIRVMRLRDPKIIKNYYRSLTAKREVASFEKYLTRFIKTEEA